MPSPVPIKRPEPPIEIWLHQRLPYSELEQVLRRAGDDKSVGSVTINLSGGKAVGLDVKLKVPGPG
jgi:hypothetical protein